MNNNLTDITLIIDRSGSMASCQQEAENGINHFIEEQKKQPGDCLLSLVQFDTDYEFVYKGINIKEVGKYTLVPRGMTALLDACGRAINETGTRLAAMPEYQRPGLVTFVITTDGGENASHEFTTTQIKSMIEKQQYQYSWKFIFLGANQDSFTNAANIGINAASVANYNTNKSHNTYSRMSDKMSQMRYACMNNVTTDCSFSDEDRKEML
jgi:uncharacterized protein YegL